MPPTRAKLPNPAYISKAMLAANTCNIEVGRGEVDTKDFGLAFSKFDVHSPADGASKLLRSLEFPEMNSRQETVAAADAKTLQWVFKSNTKVVNSCDINHWLKEGNGFYWLSGMAGSGKSTLMDFLVSSPETKEALSCWAGNGTVTVISYFFWNSGKPLQRDLRGLLRTCVYQILESDPEMASVLESLLVGSQRSSMDSNRIFEMISSETMLRKILLALLDSGQAKSVRYCFFIDALGECEGDRATLLSLLDNLVARPHVKVCTSSCPWPSFKHYFRFSARQNLEDNTPEDISMYVRERFSQREARVRDDDTATRMEDFVSEITSRSGGIFLWAVLVTRQVFEGFAKGDSRDILLNRVRAMPTKVHDLIAAILKRRVGAVYRNSAAEYLSLRSASNQPVDLLTFSVACLEEVQMTDQDDLTSILMCDAQPKIEQIAESFSACTAGLLEVSYDANKLESGRDHPIFSLLRHDVGFLHDSVALAMQYSPSQSLALLYQLLKASVLIGAWLRNDGQPWVCFARVYRQAVQFAKLISDIDPSEHRHEGFLELLETYIVLGYRPQNSGGLFGKQ